MKLLQFLISCLFFTSLYNNTEKVHDSKDLQEIVQFANGSEDVLHVNSYALNMLGAMMLNCKSSYNDVDGFIIESTGVNSLVGNCVAFENDGVGFNAILAGTAMYGCFASKNATNYSVNSPNVQNANTAAGVFARGNNFIP